jgi:3-deoxy-D-manno-octulosonic-acid transferase
MRNRERLYDAGMRLAQPLAHALAPLHPKGAAAVQGRADSAVAFKNWSKHERDATRPLILVHAPSVGEALMAQAIIAQVRLQLPDAQIAFTFFSPSAERVAGRVGADVHGYLPIDSRRAMRDLVHELTPAAIAFVRTEIWPMLGVEAHAAGTRAALVNAVLAPGSSRLRGPARFLLGPAYRRLHAIGAVSIDDAHRFETFGVSAERTFVTGDARFDQVWKRIHSIDRDSAAVARAREHNREFVIVAGSTWPQDEALLIDALRSRRTPGADNVAASDTTIIIAPHEPTPQHIAALETRIAQAGMSHTRLSVTETDDPDFIIVDSVGVLADLYSLADVAYVGGGFGDDGLHSVVEPAALGVPVVYGPRHGNAREAGDLASAGGGFVVDDIRALAHTIERLRNATERSLAGIAAEEFVRSRLGGAEANAALICGMVESAAR